MESTKRGEDPIHQEVDISQGFNQGHNDEHISMQLEDINKEVEELRVTLQNKEEQLNRFQKASELVIDAYEDLQSKYEAETFAIDTVLQEASQWYHENKKLKRQSAVLLQRLQGQDLGNIHLVDIPIDGHPNVEEEESKSTMEFMADLKERLTQLSIEKRNAEKKTEWLQVQLREAHQKLEEERHNHAITKDELMLKTELLDRLQKVSEMAVEEFNKLKEDRDEKDSLAKKAVQEIEEVRRERNVLARTSTLLMENVSSNKQLTEALMELEKATLNLEKAQDELHKKIEDETELKLNMEQLQDRLAFMLEECDKTKATEKKLREKITFLEKQVDDFQKKQKNVKSPPPPPPMPPPLPTATKSWNPIGALMSAIGLSRSKKPITAAPKEDLRKQAMDEIIEKIEKGTFRLKHVSSAESNVESLPEGSSTSPGINEMKNVLTSLRKGTSMREFERPKTSSQESNFVHSLTMKPRRRPTNFSLITPETPTPELESILQRRRQAVDEETSTTETT